jgi:ABC-2 type transport system ATP-binding protein
MIEATNLTKIYNKDLTAVKGVSFQVNKGEIFGFLGPNGAGKSTTIMMLNTLLLPSSGRASIAGFDVIEKPDQARLSLGYISQTPAVDDEMTGRENLFLQAMFYHLTKKEASERSEELLDLVGLTQRANDQVATYSGGMRKRLDIAAGLIHQPKVLFLDEPTLGLDTQTRRQIWQHINHLRKKIGMTIFITTHYMDEADSLCDRIAIIDEGEIKVIDSPDNLKNRIGSEIVCIKFGENQENKVVDAMQIIGNLSIVNSMKQHNNGCTAVVANGDVAIPKIFQAIHPSGIKTSSITIKRPSLDDVYISFTGKGLRNETGSKANAHQAHHMMKRVRK